MTLIVKDTEAGATVVKEPDWVYLYWFLSSADIPHDIIAERFPMAAKAHAAWEAGLEQQYHAAQQALEDEHANQLER